jgi:hypothetical protein
MQVAAAGHVTGGHHPVGQPGDRRRVKTERAGGLPRGDRSEVGQHRKQSELRQGDRGVDPVMFKATAPVMLAVAIATAASRALSYGPIYTTKLLRRGVDIDADDRTGSAPDRAAQPAPPPASRDARGVSH